MSIRIAIQMCEKLTVNYKFHTFQKDSFEELKARELTLKESTLRANYPKRIRDLLSKEHKSPSEIQEIRNFKRYGVY